MSRRSKVWQHFLRHTKETAECKKCNKTLKCIGGSTSTLNAHIKNVHGINISEDFSVEESDSALRKQKTLNGFIQRKSKLKKKFQDLLVLMD